MHGTGTRSAVVANPAKVKNRGPSQRQVQAVLSSAGWPPPLWLETTREDPGGGQTRQAAQAGAQVIFACGGDGTVTACASELAGTDVALPDAQPDDGLLDVAVLMPPRRRSWLPLAWSLLRHKHTTSAMETFQARHVQISSDSNTPGSSTETSSSHPAPSPQPSALRRYGCAYPSRHPPPRRRAPAMPRP
jgi:diacylglycerol kinase family enzyme